MHGSRRDPLPQGQKARKRVPLDASSADLLRDFLIARQRVKSNHMGEREKGAEKLQQQRRLGAALRENLRRRKAQAKGRSAAEYVDRVSKPHDSAGIVAEKKS
jgi:hypothetical protein